MLFPPLLPYTVPNLPSYVLPAASSNNHSLFNALSGNWLLNFDSDFEI